MDRSRLLLVFAVSAALRVPQTNADKAAALAAVVREDDLSASPGRNRLLEFDSAANLLFQSLHAPERYLAVGCSFRHCGAGVLMWDNPNNPDTQWRIKRAPNNDDAFVIENVNAPRLFLSMAKKKEEKKYKGASVQIRKNPRRADAQWRIQQAPGAAGAYVLENVNAPGLYLSVGWPYDSNGAGVLIWDNPADRHAQWRIVDARECSAVDLYSRSVGGAGALAFAAASSAAFELPGLSVLPWIAELLSQAGGSDDFEAEDLRYGSFLHP